MKINKKKLEFPKEIKDKYDRYLSRKKLDITYIDGYMIEFKNSNFSTLSDNTII